MPTAVQLVAETHDTPARLPVRLRGEGTTAQRVPFQDSMKGSLLPRPDTPTAAQKAGETHDTPARRSNALPGDGTTAQRVPFQDSIRGLRSTPLGAELPTAVQAAAEIHDTPARDLLAVGWLGLGTTDQLAPFQDSIKVAERALLVVVEPTAVQAAAETHDTPVRELPAVPRLGLGTTDQLVPFQDSMKVLCWRLPLVR